MKQQERKKHFTRSQVPTGHTIVSRLTKPGSMYIAIEEAATTANL
jgi:hypothetical protein